MNKEINNTNSKIDESPNVIIPREHQSAPKEHWMNDELRKAAEEIDKGQFTPQLKDDDYFFIGPEQLLWQHPRIAEALERMKTEINEFKSKNSQELLEKQQMYHELNEMAEQKDKWDGQGRWIGKDNEEERYGELLTPHQFMARLERVIGKRVELFRFAVMGRVAVLVDNPDKSPLILPGPYHTQGKLQVATLQYPIGTEWMQMAFTEYGIPKYAKHLGWRTALLAMIGKGIITEDEAHQAFPLKLTHASLWYRAQLYQIRNGDRADA